jgi:hypothetical protein
MVYWKLSSTSSETKSSFFNYGERTKTKEGMEKMVDDYYFSYAKITTTQSRKSLNQSPRKKFTNVNCCKQKVDVKHDILGSLDEDYYILSLK